MKKSQENTISKPIQKKSSINTINTDTKVQLNLVQKSKNLIKPFVNSAKNSIPIIKTELEFKDSIASQEYGMVASNTLSRQYKIINNGVKSITLK